MKKTRIRIIALTWAAFFIFSGASIWEGSAAVASAGDLPEKGFYAATNSFPRNTVVDITNVENNKSIRLIVSDGLDNPALLALLSRDAAEKIGMRPGSITRIIMTQPSDPIAHLRFSEGLAAGIPDYDSGNVITEDTYTPPANTNPVPGGSSPSAYVLEPEWGGSGSRGIIDLPDNYIVENAKEPEYPAVIQPEPVEEEPEYIAEEEPEPVIEEEPEYIAEEEPEPVVEEEPEYLAEEEPEPVIKEALSAYLSERLQSETEYHMVPSEERPPVSTKYDIDPASIIPGIGYATTPEPISEPVRPSSPFSAPLIAELRRDSYYIQLAAFSRAELVEGAINRIEQNYRKVLCVENNGRESTYRVLLGPLNQGESGALLQRFKSIGYTDAFVRYGR